MSENLTINAIEGEQVRINVVFDETLDPTAFEITGGNTTCPQHPITFSATVNGQTVTMTSTPLPYLCTPVPFQIIVKRLADGAEWIPVVGSIKTTKRLI